MKRRLYFGLAKLMACVLLGVTVHELAMAASSGRIQFRMLYLGPDQGTQKVLTQRGLKWALEYPFDQTLITLPPRSKLESEMVDGLHEFPFPKPSGSFDGDVNARWESYFDGVDQVALRTDHLSVRLVLVALEPGLPDIFFQRLEAVIQKLAKPHGRKANSVFIIVPSADRPATSGAKDAETSFLEVIAEARNSVIVTSERDTAYVRGWFWYETPSDSVWNIRETISIPLETTSSVLTEALDMRYSVWRNVPLALQGAFVFARVLISQRDRLSAYSAFRALTMLYSDTFKRREDTNGPNVWSSETVTAMMKPWSQKRELTSQRHLVKTCRRLHVISSVRRKKSP